MTEPVKRKTRKARKPAQKRTQPQPEEKTIMSQPETVETVRPENFGDTVVKAQGTTISGDPKPISKPGRKERIPLGTIRQKLTAPAVEGKVRRWVNDDGGRVPMAEQGGYEFVTDDGMKIGDTNIGSGNQDLGSRVSRIVGTKANGEPLRAYLMEIDKDIYDEDQNAKAARIKEVDDQIRHGNIERKPDDGRYVPRDGINYKP